MSMIGSAFPASLRRPLEGSRIAQGMMPKVSKPTQVAGPEARAISLAKTSFAPLPQEPEDACLTGVTRSLNRRLLALNISGSLRRMGSGTLLAAAKIA